MIKYLSITSSFSYQIQISTELNPRTSLTELILTLCSVTKSIGVLSTNEIDFDQWFIPCTHIWRKSQLAISVDYKGLIV